MNQDTTPHTMTRTEIIAAIDGMPVTDAVKAHTTRLLGGLPKQMVNVREIINTVDGRLAIAFNVEPSGSCLYVSILDMQGEPFVTAYNLIFDEVQGLLGLFTQCE